MVTHFVCLIDFRNGVVNDEKGSLTLHHPTEKRRMGEVSRAG
jgi:hypothetical protein